MAGYHGSYPYIAGIGGLDYDRNDSYNDYDSDASEDDKNGGDVFQIVTMGGSGSLKDAVRQTILNWSGGFLGGSFYDGGYEMDEQPLPGDDPLKFGGLTTSDNDYEDDNNADEVFATNNTSGDTFTTTDLNDDDYAGGGCDEPFIHDHPILGGEDAPFSIEIITGGDETFQVVSVI